MTTRYDNVSGIANRISVEHDQINNDEWYYPWAVLLDHEDYLKEVIDNIETDMVEVNRQLNALKESLTNIDSQITILTQDLILPLSDVTKETILNHITAKEHDMKITKNEILRKESEYQNLSGRVQKVNRKIKYIDLYIEKNPPYHL